MESETDSNSLSVARLSARKKLENALSLCKDRQGHGMFTRTVEGLQNSKDQC